MAGPAVALRPLLPTIAVVFGGSVNRIKINGMGRVPQSKHEKINHEMRSGDMGDEMDKGWMKWTKKQDRDEKERGK
jgi:hypothetical protein